VRRREALALLGGAAASWPLAGRAQPAKVPVIGVLSVGDPGALLSGLREGLGRLGYVEGQNIRIEVRSAAGKPELRALADELVRLKVEIIVARLTPAVRAAMGATQTTPIVMAPAGAPVETGMIASLARPGGNVTGLSITAAEVSGKRLQLMREMVPTIKRVALLVNGADPFGKVLIAQSEQAAPSLGLQLQKFLVSSREEVEAAFAAMAKEPADAVFIDSSLPAEPAVTLALKQRLPAFSTTRVPVDAGALMSYGGRLSDSYRDAAVYVDKILKGAKPADLPVQQPTKFDLVINLKTAKVLGLTVPQSLLQRADEVIE
jgi:putative ABC transport system substrate-binding protein